MGSYSPFKRLTPFVLEVAPPNLSLLEVGSFSQSGSYTGLSAYLATHALLLF